MQCHRSRLWYKLLFHLRVKIPHNQWFLKCQWKKEMLLESSRPPYMDCSADLKDFGAKSSHPIQIITFLWRNDSWPDMGPQYRIRLNYGLQVKFEFIIMNLVFADAEPQSWCPKQHSIMEQTVSFYIWFYFPCYRYLKFQKQMILLQTLCQKVSGSLML